jgi:hypothetical protein
MRSVCPLTSLSVAGKPIRHDQRPRKDATLKTLSDYRHHFSSQR